MRKYSAKQAAGAQKIETLGGDCALKLDDATQMGVNAHAATEPGGPRPVATEIKAWQTGLNFLPMRLTRNMKANNRLDFAIAA